MHEPTQDAAPGSVAPPLGPANTSPGDASEPRLNVTTSFQTTPRAGSLSERVTVAQKDSATPEAETPTWPRPASGRIGQYELLEELPPGGMGRVYRARHCELGHVVALKTMRAELGDQTVRARRFRREAQAVANLDHPHIIDIKDYGEEGGQHYYAMKFIGGGSLAQHRQRYQADVRAAVGLLEKVALAVQHAHDRHVFHRDLKPGNVLLEDSGEPLVADFGLAKLTDSDEITRPGEVLGTPAYMSPEQAGGRSDEVTEASDVWSLGVMLFELVVGRRPFVGKTNEDVRVRILQDEAPRPRSLRPDVDRTLEAVILKCLEKVPADRYASAGQLAADLKAWREGRPSSIRPESQLRQAWRWIQRKPLVAATAALLAAALVSAPAVVYYRDPERPLRAMQRDLSQGKKVALLGETGKPRWSQWIPEGQAVFTKTAVGDDQALVAHSVGRTFLELAPSVPMTAYRFSAEVRHLGVDGPQAVGIYLGRTPIGKQDLACTFTFNDIWRRAAGFPQAGFKDDVAICAAVVFDHSDRQRELSVQRMLLHHPYINAGQGPGPWRRLAVEVTPGSVHVAWDGKRVGAVPAGDLMGFPGNLVGGPPAGIPPGMGMSLHGGLGLFLDNGEAAFRNVVIEPLPSTE